MPRMQASKAPLTPRKASCASAVAPSIDIETALMPDSMILATVSSLSSTPQGAMTTRRPRPWA